MAEPCPQGFLANFFHPLARGPDGPGQALPRLFAPHGGIGGHLGVCKRVWLNRGAIFVVVSNQRRNVNEAAASFEFRDDVACRYLCEDGRATFTGNLARFVDAAPQAFFERDCFVCNE